MFLPKFLIHFMLADLALVIILGLCAIIGPVGSKQVNFLVTAAKFAFDIMCMTIIALLLMM